MCVVSMVGDFYGDKFRRPEYDPFRTYPAFPSPNVISPTQEEFDALKKEVLEMKELLKRALEYDRKNGEPYCEIDDKVKLLKEIAKVVGVDLSEVFAKEKRAKKVDAFKKKRLVKKPR